MKHPRRVGCHRGQVLWVARSAGLGQQAEETMRNLALLCLALVLGYSIVVMASAISAINAMIPMAVQAAANAWMTLMFEVLIMLVISLTVIAITMAGHITPLILFGWPVGLVLGTCYPVLFEALKELLVRSP